MLLFRSDWKPIRLCNHFLVLLCILVVPFLAGGARSQSQLPPEVIAGQADDSIEARDLYRPIRTDSPQQTLRSFVILRSDLEDELGRYLVKKSRQGEDRIVATILQLVSLIDMSEVAPSSRRDVGIDTVAHLLDIFGRGVLPKILSVPDAEDLEQEEAANGYLIPNTPFRLVRIVEGEFAGEFLFSAKTVRTAPDFARAIAGIPLNSPLDIESWEKLAPHLTGWMIPNGLVSAVPDFLNREVLDTPVWKVFLVLIIAAAGFSLFRSWYNFLHLRLGRSGLTRKLVMSAWPLSLILFILLLQQFIDYQINHTGTFAVITSFSFTAIRYLAVAFLLWLLVQAFFEWIILNPKISDQGLNASMLRLLAQFISIIGSLIILAFGAQQLGMPVFSIIAGLGIGGLAIALAIRPTLENLIGGFILYWDKPVRIGDICQLEGKLGRVEQIGVRSTQIRGLDRTLVSIPNAMLADMQITNWSSCDEMLILHTIGLRYETDSDQLRYVLAKMREMLLSHPKITSDTARVRFVGYGSSSLEIEIRAYAKTGDFNEFYAIREDIMLRFKDIVSESGTGFAFPSLTMYAGQDDGLDKERSEQAKNTVADWRREGHLPFPGFTTSDAERFRDTLDYPPRGSSQPDGSGGKEVAVEPRRQSTSAKDKK